MQNAYIPKLILRQELEKQIQDIDHALTGVQDWMLVGILSH